MSKENKTLNKHVGSDNFKAAVSCCSLLEELNLKLIAMSCFAQEHYNENVYDVTKMNIDELKDWIKKKKLHYCLQQT